MDIGWDIRNLLDVFPIMLDKTAAVHGRGRYGSRSRYPSIDRRVSDDVVLNTETQVDDRWETTLAVVPFVDECGRPAGWLDSESDCCVMDEIVLVPEMSPIVSMRSAAVPTFLPAMSEVFSLAVLAGGRC